MFKQLSLAIMLIAAGGAMGVVVTAGAETHEGVPGTHVAELAPRSISPAKTMHSSELSGRDMTKIEQKLASMQRAIDLLKSDVSRLKQRKVKIPQPGPGNQSVHSADEAYTLAAEARDIAMRAEQKADQALANSYSN